MWGFVGKGTLGVGMKLGDTPAFLSLTSSPKPEAGPCPQCTASAGQGGQPGMGPQAPAGMKQVLLGWPLSVMQGPSPNQVEGPGGSAPGPVLMRPMYFPCLYPVMASLELYTG